MAASHCPHEQCTRMVHLLEHLPMKPQPNIECGEKGGPPPMQGSGSVPWDIPNLLRNGLKVLVGLRVGPPDPRKPSSLTWHGATKPHLSGLTILVPMGDGANSGGAVGVGVEGHSRSYTIVERGAPTATRVFPVPQSSATIQPAFPSI